MSRRTRLVVALGGALGVAALLALAFVGMPSFGSSFHPYRDLAVPAAVAHGTANVVSAVNFDQRALDTLGEETILLGSVIGVAVLLRPSKEEQESEPSRAGRVLDATAFLGYVLLPTTLIVGADVVAHGAITPGGGFQGGVVLATGLHLLYVAGRYETLERLRPLPVFEVGEAVGTAAFVCLGFAGLVSAGAFLANVVSTGSFGQLVSAGTVPLLSIAVGIEVASSVVVLLAQFLEQAVLLQRRERQ